MEGQATDRRGRPWDEKTRALVACLEALLELHRERVGTATALAARSEAANDGAVPGAGFGGPGFMPGRTGPFAPALRSE